MLSAKVDTFIYDMASWRSGLTLGINNALDKNIISANDVLIIFYSDTPLNGPYLWWVEWFVDLGPLHIQ